MSFSGAKMSILVVAFMTFSLCSTKSIAFNNFATLSAIFTQSTDMSACDICELYVEMVDQVQQLPQKYNTPEKLAKALQKHCSQITPESPVAVFCKALEGKFVVFTKANFQHRKNHEINPCKVAQVCSADSVQRNNVASLSQVFALNEETVACKICKEVVTELDNSELKEEYNTPEKLAKILQEICSEHPPASKETQPMPPTEEFCNAIEGKYDVFAKAYFRHRKDHEVNPCKEAQVC